MPSTVFTTVTASPVKDPSGNPYASGTYNINFVNPSTGLPTIGGYTIAPSEVSGTLDASGNLNIQLLDNSQVSPSGSQWRFSICNSAGTICFSTNITISGTTQDITATLQAAAAILTNVSLNQSVRTLNNIRFADQFTGVDAGAKIAAAIADLPSTGGTVDARGLEGAQTSATNFLSGIGTKPVTLVLGHVTLTTVPLTGASNLHIIGAGKYDTVLKLANSSNASLLTYDTKSKWELSDLTLDGNRTNQSGTSHIIKVSNSGGGLKYQMSRLYITQAHDDGIHIDAGAIGDGQGSDLIFYFNDGVGLYAGGTDDGWSNIDVGQSGLAGVVVSGANVRITNAKSWFSGRITPASGVGFDIQAERTTIAGAEAQDNQAHGFKITANDQNISGAQANSNSQASSGTYDGFYLTNLTNSYISGNAPAVADLNTYQGYGVNFTGTTTKNIVQLTSSNNVTAPVGGTPEGNEVTVVDSSGSTTAYRTGSNIHFGTTAATTGLLAFPNNQGISGRNAANNADVQVIRLDTNNGVNLGNSYLTAFSTTTLIPSVTYTGSTPTVTAGRVGIGATTGFGAGAAGTAVTTTTKGAGTGPTTPQTIVNYLKVNIGGTDYYVPLVQ